MAKKEWEAEDRANGVKPQAPRPPKYNGKDAAQEKERKRQEEAYRLAESALRVNSYQNAARQHSYSIRQLDLEAEAKKATEKRKEAEKKREDFKKDFFRPKDESGRPLTYQEQQNQIVKEQAAQPETAYKRQEDGSLVPVQSVQFGGVPYQERQNTNETLDEFAKGLARNKDAVKAEKSKEKEAQAAYEDSIPKKSPDEELLEAETAEKTAQEEFDRFQNEAPLATGKWTARGIPQDQAEYLSKQQYYENKRKEYVAQGMPNSYAEEMARQATERDWQEYSEESKSKSKALEDAKSYADNQRNLKHNRDVDAANLQEINSMPEEDKENFLNYIKAKQNYAAGMENPMSTPSYVKYEEARSGKYDRNRLSELEETYSRYQNMLETQKVSEAASARAEEDFTDQVLPWLGSFPLKLAGSVTGTFGSASDMLTGTGQYIGPDPNNPGNLPNVYADTLRREMTKNIQGDGSSKWDAFKAMAFQAVNSTGDSLLRAYTAGPASLALSGSATFNETLLDATKKGASTKEALMLAVMNAGIETATEKIPLDNLLDAMATNPGNWGEILLKVGGNALAEASTEELSLIGTTLTEAAILRESSDRNTMIRELEQNGYTHDQAVDMVNRQFLNEAWETLVVSGLSGGASEAGGLITGAARNQNNTPDFIQDTVNGLQGQETTQDTQAPGGLTQADIDQLGAQWANQEVTKEIPPMQPMTDEQIQAAADQVLGADSAKKLNVTDTEIQENIQAVGSMESVKDLTGREFVKGDGLKQRVIDFFGKIGKAYNSRVGEVLLTKKGVKDDFGHGMTDEKAAAFAAVPDVIKNGKVVQYEPNRKGKSYDSVTIVAPVTIDGEPYMMNVIAHRDNGESRFYLHDVYAESDVESRTAPPTSQAFATDENAHITETGSKADASTGNYGARGAHHPSASNSTISVMEQIWNVKKNNQGNVYNGESTPQVDTENVSMNGGQEGDRNLSAAEADFTGKGDYYDLLTDENTQRDRPGDVRPVEVPKTDANGKKVSEAVGNIYGSALTSDAMANRIEELVMTGALGYDSVSNKTQLENAYTYLFGNDADMNAERVITAEKEIHDRANKGRIGDSDIARAMILYDYYNQQDGVTALNRAADVFVDLQQMATRSGRNLQLLTDAGAKARAWATVLAKARNSGEISKRAEIALKNSMDFRYSMVAETKHQDNLNNMGISPDISQMVTDALDRVTGTGSINQATGKRTVTNTDKYSAIANLRGVSTSDTDSIMHEWMPDYDPNVKGSDRTEVKYDYMRQEMGLSPKTYAALYSAKNGNSTKEDALDEMESILHDRKTAELAYKILDGNTKTMKTVLEWYESR